MSFIDGTVAVKDILPKQVVPQHRWFQAAFGGKASLEQGSIMTGFFFFLVCQGYLSPHYSLGLVWFLNRHVYIFGANTAHGKRL